LRKNVIRISLAVGCAIVLSVSAAAAAENWVGRWTLDATKSKYSPGPAPKSQSLTFEQTKDGIKLTSESVTADGKTNKGGYVSKFDGKDVPWAGNPDADTASPRKIDDNNYENTWKKGGKTTVTSKTAVSKDGKTLTVNQTGTNAKGETVNNVAVYDRQ